MGQPNGSIERVPPHDVDAEQGVLASAIVDREALAEVRDIIGPGDFYRAAHGTIFRALIKLHDAGSPIDLITVRDALGDANLLDEVGGYGYIVDLASSIPTTAHAAYYAGIVAEKATLRALIRAGSEIVSKAFAEDDVSVIVDQAEQAILGVNTRQNSGAVETIQADVTEVCSSVEARGQCGTHIVGTPSGFYDLDHLTLGFHGSDLLVLAGRPAMGKTAIALNFCRNVAVDARRPVLIFSLEMSKGQLIERLVASESGIPSNAMRTGRLTKDQWGSFYAASGVIAEAPIVINDDSGITIQDVRSYARRTKARFPDLGMVMVDYIQLLSVAGMKGDNRVAEVGAISRGLKRLARELHVPVIGLSQLSRKVEDRTDKRPMLSDLRESGSIEQDADLVMFIYRDEYYNPDTDKKNQAEIIIAKHRNGPVGDVSLYFEKELTRFSSLGYQPKEA